MTTIWKPITTTDPREIRRHVGHTIEIVTYGNKIYLAIECLDCYQIIADWSTKQKGRFGS